MKIITALILMILKCGPVYSQEIEDDFKYIDFNKNQFNIDSTIEIQCCPVYAVEIGFKSIEIFDDMKNIDRIKESIDADNNKK